MVHLADEHATHSCPRCGSSHVDLVDEMVVLICFDCGYEDHYDATITHKEDTPCPK